ncbi:hypothetical protein B0H12DRAFT_1326755 [Mycena haematopus]|nr:hypothetical protein B0H12DRAFT_1326755 [Mycena haematopus]
MPPSYRADYDSPPDYATDAGDDWAPSRTQSDPSPTSQTASTGSAASEPRYVYYHVYTPDGMLRWLKNFCRENPLVGRIKATSVPPPLTAASLKRAIVQAEGLPDPAGDLTALFQTRDAQIAMNTSARVDIFSGDLGATIKTPVALVFLNSPKESLVVVSENVVKDYLGNNLPLLYYRLYTRGGDAPSACPLDPTEPSLGRIKRELISPPRNALCVQKRIAKVEGKPTYQFADLFPDVEAHNAHHSNARVSDTAGSSRESPILIVQPERSPGLYNRPVQIIALPPETDRRNSQQWLKPSLGDILRTDGIARNEGYYRESVYTAVDNQSGRTGWISAQPNHSKLLDEESGPCSIQ